MENIIGLRDLRENVADYAKKVAKGSSFIVVKQSRPLFKITPISFEEETWETLVDFRKINKGGVAVEKILSALNHGQTSKSSRKALKRA